MLWLVKRFYYSILDAVYPPLCLHCGDYIHKKGHLLCDVCSNLLELPDPKDQCPYCFAHFHSKKEKCRISDSVIYRAAAALEYSGPASTLVKELKYNRRDYVARGLGAFVAAQFVNLQWEMPDVITPVPQSFFQGLMRGYNHSDLIAYEFAKIIGVPVRQLLKRKFGGLQQDDLPKEQRHLLDSSAFVLKKHDIAGKVIFLIDDVMTTRATILACAETLWQGDPKRIYVLTVCC
jgi:ComF family protein